MNKTLDTRAPEEIKAPVPARTLTLGTILVAVDLSPHSEATARYAAGLAERFGALMTLVHVCPI